MRQGRPKGSKNKPKRQIPVNLDGLAKQYADKFIAGEHIAGAETLALRILEKIRASKKRLTVKYGDEI